MKTITKRTCANCAAFNAAPAEDEPTCANLVSIVIHHLNEEGMPIVIWREPHAAFRCDDHQTHDEDAAQTLAMAS